MKLLMTLLLAVASVPAWSQNDGDSSVSCITYWKKGETKVYSILHEKTTGNQNNKHLSFAYEAHVTVLDSTAEDYTVKWVFHNPVLPGRDLSALSQPLPVFEGMQMIFRITSVGTFIELINWEEVRDSYIHLTEMGLPGKMDSTMRAIVDTTKAVFSTKENVEGMLIQEIQLFHLAYGAQFTTRQVSEKTQLSNPFGGDPLPAVQTYQVTKLDRWQDSYSLVIRQMLDSNNLERYMDTMFKKMGVKDGKELQTAKAQLSTLVINDFTEYQFISSSGWIRRLHYLRTAGSAALKQSDAYTITLKD